MPSIVPSPWFRHDPGDRCGADKRGRHPGEADHRERPARGRDAARTGALLSGAHGRDGWTVEELGQHIGKAPHRITERTVLLKLAPEYQSLLASGNLKPSEATELARLTPRGQATLFKAIRSGGCKNYNDLRAMANALVRSRRSST